jgi:hypothetical protein
VWGEPSYKLSLESGSTEKKDNHAKKREKQGVATAHVTNFKCTCSRIENSDLLSAIEDPFL